LKKLTIAADRLERKIWGQLLTYEAMFIQLEDQLPMPKYRVRVWQSRFRTKRSRFARGIKAGTLQKHSVFTCQKCWVVIVFT
jgi:hypothetical protein